MRAVLALASKDLRLLVRDRTGFFFVFFFPLLYAVFYGAIMSGMNSGGGMSAIRIVVVDEDGTAGSKSFAETLAGAEEFGVETAATREDAFDLVRTGRRVAAVVLTPGFGEATGTMFWGEPARLVLAVDPSRSAEAGMIEGLLTRHGFEGVQRLFSEPEFARANAEDALDEIRNDPDTHPAVRAVVVPFLSSLAGFMTALPEAQAEAADDGDEGDEPAPAAGWQPLVIETADVARSDAGKPRSSYDISVPQAIIWGVMGAAAGFGLSLVTERTRGTLLRLRVAPVGRAQILAGKGLACFAVTLGVSALLVVIGSVVFGMRVGSPGLLAVALICVSLCFVGVMMLLSCIGRTEASAGGIGWAVMLVFAMIGGAMIPQFVMPEWMQGLGRISPIFWSIRAMEGAVWRDYSPGEMLLPCGVLVGIGAVCLASGSRLFRWGE